MEHLFQVDSLWAFIAGLLSVLSACILPVLPIIVAGEVKEHSLRPVFFFNFRSYFGFYSYWNIIHSFRSTFSKKYIYS